MCVESRNALVQAGCASMRRCVNYSCVFGSRRVDLVCLPLWSWQALLQLQLLFYRALPCADSARIATVGPSSPHLLVFWASTFLAPHFALDPSTGAPQVDPNLRMEDITAAKDAAAKQRGAEIITAFPEDFASSSSGSSTAAAANGSSGAAATEKQDVDEDGK